MNIERLFDLLLRYISHFPSEEVLCFKKHRIWKKYGIEKVISMVDDLSIGLQRAGVEQGDKIAIVSSNRPEWNIVDFACQQIGAISVPIYTNFSKDDINAILKETKAKYVFVSDQESAKKVKIASKKLKSVEDVFSFDYVEGTTHWSVIRALSEGIDSSILDETKNKITGDDVVSIIYTSGTTGKPKGVVLTHKNIISNIIALSQVIPLEPGAQCRILSFLPLSHIFERSAVYMYLYFGCHIYYAESIEKIPENLREVQPFSFTTVPNILEKLYNNIMNQAHFLKGWKRAVFYWAFKLALQYDTKDKKSWWYRLQLAVASNYALKIFRT